jgi:hypothetical protein
MKFEVFTALNIHAVGFWVVTPSSQVGISVSEENAASIFKIEAHPDVGGITFFRNVVNHLPD